MAKPRPIFLLRHIQMPSSKVQTPSKRQMEYYFDKK